MASRKEDKQRLREQRLAAEREASASARKRLLLSYVVAGLLGTAILVGVVIAIAGGSSDKSPAGEGSDNSDNVNTTFGFLPEDLPVDEREGTPPPELVNGDLEGAAREAGCDVQLDLPDEGNTHFSDENKVVKYDTNPPTSGEHYGNPSERGAGALADGAFLETPNWNRAVHSLEHGRIEVQYSPDLPEEDQLALKGVFDEAPPGVDLFPNAEMPYDVAVTAWTQLVGCKSYDGPKTLDVVRDFRDQFLGQGPEGAIPIG